MRGFFSVLLAGALLCVLPAAIRVQAAQTVTLRVAFYPLDGFFEYDAQGRETGYGVELLDRLTHYTGIRFTYVPAESWESTKGMLLNDEADVRMPGTQPASPSQQLGYTRRSVLDTCYAMLTLVTRDDLVYEDTDDFSRLKVALTESQYQTLEIQNYLSQLNLTEKNLVFYHGYNDCRDALKAGKVDALLTNIMDMEADMKLLAKFSSCSNYISMTRDNPYLDVLDEALYQLNMQEPTFLAGLYTKWFPERAVTPLNREEQACLDSVDSLCFYFSDSQGYLSRRGEDGSYMGLYPALAQKVCDKLGLEYHEYQEGDTPATAVIPDFYYDYAWAQENDANITDAYLEVKYYKVSRKGEPVDDTSARVAAIRGLRITQDYLSSGYSQDQMVWCEDYAACMEAVYAKRADVTYINRYTAEYYLNLYHYNSLSAVLTEYSNPVCMAVVGENSALLASILNKTLRAFSQEDLSAILVDQTAVRPEQNLFVEWLYQNPPRTAAYTSAVAVVVVGLLGLVVTTQRTRRQNLALQKANGAKQDFLSRMSHDMRTPMNAILGFSDLGQNSRTLEEACAYHEKIHEASEYLLQLINDTLDLSKLETDTLVIRLAPYQSTEFTEMLENILAPKAAAKGVHFTIENMLSAPQTAMFDKLRLQQIFLNLLNNAIKFTPAGGHVCLKIDQLPVQGGRVTVIFTVEDDGIGMTETFQKEMLYKPFVQERRVENAESGTGLGLSIVKELVSAMGGTITCDSAVGRGTRFVVTLHTCLAEKEKPAPAPAALPSLAGRCVLVCEDHPLNREILNKLLADMGIRTENAVNGRQGVELFCKAPQGHFDAVLMDIRMPEMDGLEAARTIRAMTRPDAATVPILALTANAFEEDRKAAEAAGMNAHLAKPIDRTVLYRTLADCIARSGKQTS